MREQLIAATRNLLRSKGLAAVSTRAIAREAGCAEGTLYNHFATVGELLLAVFMQSLPQFSGSVSGLALRVGTSSVEETLARVHAEALEFYRETIPLMGALFARPDLLVMYREALAGQNRGPHIPAEHLVAYLRAEQRLGRVRADADATAYAELLLGSAFQRAFREQFSGTPADDRQAEAILASLVRPLITDRAEPDTTAPTVT